MSTDDMDTRIKQLKLLKENLEKVVTSADVISQETSTSSKSLNDIIEVNDDYSVVSKKMASVSNDMSETSNYINDFVIPAIDAELKECNENVASAQEVKTQTSKKDTLEKSKLGKVQQEALSKDAKKQKEYDEMTKYLKEMEQKRYATGRYY